MKKSYKNVDIHTLLKEQGLPYDIKVLGEQNIGQYRVNFENVAELLAHPKRTTSALSSVLKTASLSFIAVCFSTTATRCGRYSPQGKHHFDSSLDEQRAEDVKIKLRVVSLQPDNKKENQGGDWRSDGEKTHPCTVTVRPEAEAKGVG